VMQQTKDTIDTLAGFVGSTLFSDGRGVGSGQSRVTSLSLSSQICLSSSGVQMGVGRKNLFRPSTGGREETGGEKYSLCTFVTLGGDGVGRGFGLSSF